MRAEIVCRSILFGEGPVWCPDGTLVVTSVVEGALYRVEPGTGTASRFADTGGGANGAALAVDGAILVTQNGGIDLSSTGFFAEPPPYREATPGLQLALPDGTVRYLTADGLNAPNDLVVTPGGRVLFTDPPHWPPSGEGVGRVMAYERDGALSVYASDFSFCNGIALDPGGHVVVVEQTGLQRVFPDGSREWVVEHLGRGGGDGFCVDIDGRFYVASTTEHGVRVVDPDGSIVDFLAIDGEGLTTNCCFGGPDRRTLFCTDAVPGDVVAFEGMPTPGLAMVAWPGPSAEE